MKGVYLWRGWGARFGRVGYRWKHLYLYLYLYLYSFAWSGYQWLETKTGFSKPASRAFGHHLSVSVDGEHDEDKGRCHIGCCHLWLLQGVTSCLMWGGTGHVICSWGNACVRWAGGEMVIYERTVLCRVLPEQFGKKPPLTSLTSTRDQIASMMSSSSPPSSSNHHHFQQSCPHS